MIKNLALNGLFSLQTNHKKKGKKVSTPFDEIFFAENKKQLKNLHQPKQKNTKFENLNTNRYLFKHNDKIITHSKSKIILDAPRTINHFSKNEKLIKQNIKGKILYYKPKNSKKTDDNYQIQQASLENRKIKTKPVDTKKKQPLPKSKSTVSFYKENSIPLLQYLNTKIPVSHFVSKKSFSESLPVNQKTLTVQSKKTSIKSNSKNQLPKIELHNIEEKSKQEIKKNFYKSKNISQVNVQQIFPLKEHKEERSKKIIINSNINKHITDTIFIQQYPRTTRKQNIKKITLTKTDNNIKNATAQKSKQKTDNQINLKREYTAKNVRTNNNIEKYDNDINLNIKQNSIILSIKKEIPLQIQNINIHKPVQIQHIKIKPVKTDNLNLNYKKTIENPAVILNQDKNSNQVKKPIQKQKISTENQKISYTKVINKTKKVKTVEKPNIKSFEKIDLTKENNTLEIKDFNYQIQNTAVKSKEEINIKKQINHSKAENNTIIENISNREFSDSNTSFENNQQENEYKNHLSYEEDNQPKTEKKQFEITFNYEKVSIRTVVRNNYIRLILNSGFEFKNPESLLKDIENILQNSGFSKINVILKEKPKKAYQSNKTNVSRAIDVKV